MIVERLITQNKVVYFTTNLQKEIIQKATKRLRKVIHKLFWKYTPNQQKKTKITVKNSKPTNVTAKQYETNN